MSKVYNQILKNLKKPKLIRNIAIIAHIDHGKTTLTDNFMGVSKIISNERVGDQMFTDFHADERARGITINSSTVSFTYDSKHHKNTYLINLIDSPGHVDFSGEVVKAMRAIDGVILVVDAVEGIMTQTEAVLRQALNAGVSAVLYINKIDRLISELRLSSAQIGQKINLLVKKINALLVTMKGPAYQNYFSPTKKGFAAGNVVFGSAKYSWGRSFLPHKGKTSFSDIVKNYCKAEVPKIAGQFPLAPELLDIVIMHLPSPIDSRNITYDMMSDSKIAREVQKMPTYNGMAPSKSISKCEINGPVIAIVVDLIHDTHMGMMSYVRVISGTIVKDSQLYGERGRIKPSKILLSMGKGRIPLDFLPAGNIGVLQGVILKIGQTISEIEKFPQICGAAKVLEPVVSRAIYPKKSKDLSALMRALDTVTSTDITLKLRRNDSGQCVLYGVGELHLQVVLDRIRNEKNIEILESEPETVYKGYIDSNSKIITTQTSNKHNLFLFSVFPLPKSIITELSKHRTDSLYRPKQETQKYLDCMSQSEISEMGGITQARKILKSVIGHKNENMLFNVTRGVQRINETLEHILSGFYQAVNSGGLLKKSMKGLGVRLEDCKLHVDYVHRGPSQVKPAVYSAISQAIQDAKPGLLEPYYHVTVDTKIDHEPAVIKEMRRRGGEIGQNEYIEGAAYVKINSDIPIRRMTRFQDDMRSKTQGNAIVSMQFAGFRPMLKNDCEQLITANNKK